MSQIRAILEERGWDWRSIALGGAASLGGGLLGVYAFRKLRQKRRARGAPLPYPLPFHPIFQ
eukprot:354621-Pelagomonas_calceolata.AAC.1